MRWSLWYWFMKQWVGFALRIFYRKVHFHNRNRVPNNTAILLTPNHQNAFMDAITLAAFLRPQTSFLVRADVFKAKFAAMVLRSLKMMPIYRQRDGIDSLEKNEAIFDYCYQLLKRKNAIILFPEGNHNNQHFLRPLKKGVARIAFGAEEKYDFQSNVHVVPVGINYSNYTDMGSELLINIGKPFKVSEFEAIYKENQAKGLLALKNRLGTEMKELIIHAPQKETYDLLQELMPMARETVLAAYPSNADHEQVQHFEADKRLIAAVESRYQEAPEEIKELESKVNDYQELLEEYNYVDTVVQDEAHRGLFWQGLYLLLFLPVFLYGLIFNFIPWIIPEKLVQSKIKDRHFHSSIKVAAGVFLFPIYWGLLAIPSLLLIEQGEIELLWLFMLPMTGMFALDYWRVWKKLRARMSFNGKRKQDDQVQRLISLKSSILERVRKTL